MKSNANIKNLLKDAKDAFNKRHIKENARKSLIIYQKIIQTHENYEALWRYAHVCAFYGRFYSNNSDEREEIYKEGVKASQKALKIKQNGIEAHYFLGLCYGELANVKMSLSLARKAKEQMEKVISIDKNSFEAFPFIILGRLYFKTPGWPIGFGDDNLSIKYLKIAVSMTKSNRYAYYYLADVLYDERHYNEAQGFAKKGLAVPLNKEFIIDDTACLEKLKELNEKIKMVMQIRKEIFE